jgi:cob(I)alamin adenosyltransferase
VSGEYLPREDANRALRVCRAELATYRASAEDCMRVLEASIKQAESERDTALAALKDADEFVMRSGTELAQRVREHKTALAALQAKVARAVGLAEKWSTWLPAWAKDSLLEALR